MSGSYQLSDVQQLYTRYSAPNSNAATGATQDRELQTTLVNLKAKLANVKKVSDTYDREYLDRMADRKISFWQLRGITTLQDWVLFFFFLLYTIVSLGLASMIYMNSSGFTSTNSSSRFFRPMSPLFNVVMLLGSAFVIGIMITATIVRFA